MTSDIISRLADLGITPADVRIEPLLPRHGRPAGTRVWRGDDLIARTCAAEEHVGPHLLLATDFIAHRRSPGGRASVCRTCKHARRQDPAVREREREYSRARSQNPVVRERIRQRTVDGRNAESALRSRARYRARTAEQITADRARLRPDGTKRCRSGHVAALEEFGGNVNKPDGLRDYCRPCKTAAERRRLIRRAMPLWEDGDLYACTYCGASFEEVEHVIPKHHGGDDSPENLVPSCYACNRGIGGKFDTPVIDWLSARDPYIAAWIAAMLPEEVPAWPTPSSTPRTASPP